MRNKTINELEALSNPLKTDTIPIWDGTAEETKKVSLDKIAVDIVTVVNILPTSPNIQNRIYRYANAYFVGNETAQIVTHLASVNDIPPTVEWLAATEPLPIGSAIKEHIYAQPYTTAGGDTKYNYYIGKTGNPNTLVQLETGSGSDIFIGTQAEWDLLSTAEKNEYQQANLTDVNSVVHVPVDVVADGNMNPVTSNAVFDSLYLKGTSATEVLNISRETIVAAGTAYNYTTTATIPTDGWYKFQVQANMKDNAGVISNWVKFKVGTIEVVSVSTFQPAWNNKTNTVIIPVKAGTIVTYNAYCEAYAAGSGTDITYGNYGSVYKIA